MAGYTPGSGSSILIDSKARQLHLSTGFLVTSTASCRVYHCRIDERVTITVFPGIKLQSIGVTLVGVGYAPSCMRKVVEINLDSCLAVDDDGISQGGTRESGLFGKPRDYGRTTVHFLALATTFRYFSRVAGRGLRQRNTRSVFPSHSWICTQKIAACGAGIGSADGSIFDLDNGTQGHRRNLPCDLPVVCT